MGEKREEQNIPFLAWPAVGNTLTVLSGISFLFLCMILPLVGPAAVHGSGSPGAGPAPYLKQNYMAFSAVLALSFVLGVAAIVSKIERRKVDGSPLPMYSIGLVVVLVLILIAFALGLFGI